MKANHRHKIKGDALRRLASSHCVYVRSMEDDVIEYDTAHDGHEPWREQFDNLVLWVYGAPPVELIDFIEEFSGNCINKTIGKVYYHEDDGWTFRVAFASMGDSDVFMRNRKTDMKLSQLFKYIRDGNRDGVLLAVMGRD